MPIAPRRDSSPRSIPQQRILEALQRRLRLKIGIEQQRPVGRPGLVDPAVGIPHAPDRDTGPLRSRHGPQVRSNDVVIALLLPDGRVRCESGVGALHAHVHFGDLDFQAAIRHGLQGRLDRRDARPVDGHVHLEPDARDGHAARFHAVDEGKQVRRLLPAGFDVVVVVEQIDLRVDGARVHEGLVDECLAHLLAEHGTAQDVVDRRLPVVRQCLVHHVPAHHPALEMRNDGLDMVLQHRRKVARVVRHEGGYLVIGMPDQRVSMHIDAIRMRERHEIIGLAEREGVFLRMQIAHLHDVASCHLIKVREHDGLLLGARAAIDDAVVFEAGINGHADRKARDGLQSARNGGKVRRQRLVAVHGDRQWVRAIGDGPAPAREERPRQWRRRQRHRTARLIGVIARGRTGRAAAAACHADRKGIVDCARRVGTVDLQLRAALPGDVTDVIVAVDARRHLVRRHVGVRHAVDREGVRQPGRDAVDGPRGEQADVRRTVQHGGQRHRFRVVAGCACRAAAGRLQRGGCHAGIAQGNDQTCECADEILQGVPGASCRVHHIRDPIERSIGQCYRLAPLVTL